MRMLTAFFTALLFFPAPLLAAVPERPVLLPAFFQAAIDARQSARAMPHLDVEKLVSSVFTDTLPQINESVKKGEIKLSPPLAAALASLNSGNSVTQRTAIIFLTSELAKFIAYGVDSGAFAGNPLPEDQRMQLDGGVFSRFGDISLARKEFSESSLLQDHGKTALIQTKLYDHGVRRAYTLKLRLELRDGLWKACAVENAAELYKELLQPRY